MSDFILRGRSQSLAQPGADRAIRTSTDGSLVLNNRYAELAELIHATNLAKCTCEILDGLSPLLVDLGKMLGTSDLVSQIAGRYYLERCRYFLFKEFVAAGADRTISPSGDVVILYPTPEDLLRKTPGFYEHLVRPRLDGEFSQAYRYIAAHFGGDDPYARSIQRNLDFLRGLIERNDFSRLARKPVPLMPVPVA